MIKSETKQTLITMIEHSDLPDSSYEELLKTVTVLVCQALGYSVKRKRKKIVDEIREEAQQSILDQVLA